MDLSNDVMKEAAFRSWGGASSAAATHPCPLCSSTLIRVQPRAIDRLMSFFAPVRRYRCAGSSRAPACAWRGNVFLSDQPDGNNETSDTAFSDMSFDDMAQITLNSIGDAVLVTDPRGIVTYLNRVAEKLTGWASVDAIGRPVDDVFHIVDETTRERRISPSKRAISEGRIVELELGSVLIRHDGTDIAIEDSAAPILNRQGRLVGAVIVFHDARESRYVTEKMSHLAQHDSLTGLPNRLLFLERLTQAIGMAGRHHKQVALLFLDLDHFKQINDTYGHAVGDQLLQAAGADIVSCVRATDTVGRIWGDEFVILLTQVEEMQDAAQVAEKLLARFAGPRLIGGHNLHVGLSIGISSYPANGHDAMTLMQNADTAMYTTKAQGRNNFQFCHREREQAVPVRTFT